LIGVDTPEVHGRSECYGQQASEFAKRELGGRDVLVDLDVQPTDRFGRALVYVWTADGVLFNARLVEEGFAQQLTVPPNIRYADLFTALVRSAREGDRGLWSSC
jgi:micrococcal nuclease